ncbi:hypothetical protein H3N89_gp29 [Microbacterium phage MonChoix]|uniref:Uncharacterized protein n=1 Tax=Microbacterium phage MonChoix TaxID=2590880 RepID=A0A4Y6EMD7_9CAUD|nr:hypothetical protein H3N89_gp29 [Microbacterium phage MonChoix]QDF15994.1 hypothetical protein SEA_MONCHOIX_29 [Microbacterium phage MonChoix]
MANITTLEHEGFYYIQAGDIFAKGCRRCGGTGHYSFNGFDSICYLCGNTYEGRIGDIFENEAAAKKWCHERAVRKAQADRKRQREYDAKVAAAEARREALKAADPEVFEFLMGIVIEDDTQKDFDTYEEWAAQATQVRLERDGFIRTMAETLRWVGPSKDFTPNMIAAVRRTMEKRATLKAASVAAPEGRVTVTGEVVGTKVVEGDYGTAYKITVKDDRGFRVYVSIPKQQADQAYDEWFAAHEDTYRSFGYAVWFMGADEVATENGVKGRRITFDAALERSRDDESFAFGKRPTKGAWL